MSIFVPAARMSTTKTESPCLLLHLLERCRPREQKHQVGVECARGPDLLTPNHVPPVNAFGTGLDPGRVQPHRGLGDSECLQPDLARGDSGQEPRLLLLTSVAEQRAHDVHLRMTGARRASGGVDLFEDDARRHEAEAGATVFLGNERREPAVLGQSADDLLWIAVGLELPPVLARGSARRALGRTPGSRRARTAQQNPSAPDNTHTRDVFKPPTPHLPRCPGHERARPREGADAQSRRGVRRTSRTPSWPTRRATRLASAPRALSRRATGEHRRSPSASTG